VYQKLRCYAKKLRLGIRYYRAILDDPGTPRLPKALLAIAVGYMVVPIDIIPDFIPVLGYLDDLILVPGLVWLAMRLVPAAIKEAHRPLLDTAGCLNDCTNQGPSETQTPDS
jgi:uncharacterized membrane protein YkvA (DUF1232 family)